VRLVAGEILAYLKFLTRLCQYGCVYFPSIEYKCPGRVYSEHLGLDSSVLTGGSSERGLPIWAKQLGQKKKGASIKSELVFLCSISGWSTILLDCRLTARMNFFK